MYVSSSHTMNSAYFNKIEMQNNSIYKPLDRRKFTLVSLIFQPNSTVLMFLVFFLAWLHPVSAISNEEIDCPNFCTCSFENKLVNCSNRSLRKIPQPIPSWVATL